MKIVINSCYGGFGLSHDAMMMYSDIKKLNLLAIEKEKSLIRWEYFIDGVQDDEHYFWDGSIKRDDKDLVAIVETLGDGASSAFANLKVVEIPDDVNWTVEEYDGMEWVSEVHRTWR